MNIKTIIFDIGNVLVGYNWDKLLMSLFDNDSEVVNELKNALFYSGIWDEVDRGVWTEEELIEGFCKFAPNRKTEILVFWENAGKALWQFDFTKSVITKLKDNGYQVLFLSNWSEHMKEQALGCLDFLPMMDGGVFSYEEKLIKPDVEIYKCIEKKYTLIPNECIFLDDKKENIDAAQSCGFNTIHVVDNNKAIEELYLMTRLQ